MRKSRRGFRSRRQPLRKRVWIPKVFNSIATQRDIAGDWADLLELVSPEDYVDNFVTGTFPRRRETGSVVRTVGRLTVDTVIGAPGSNGTEWSAAVFVRSRNAVLAEFPGNPSTYFIHPSASLVAPAAIESNITRLRPMQMCLARAYSGTFRLNEVGSNCSDYFSWINRPADMDWDFDITQKRKMSGDEACYMLVSGNTVCSLEGFSAFLTMMSYTLILDD